MDGDGSLSVLGSVEEERMKPSRRAPLRTMKRGHVPMALAYVAAALGVDWISMKSTIENSPEC